MVEAAEESITQLSESARRQREIAQGLLDQARLMDNLIEAEKDPENKNRIIRLRDSVVSLARALVSNATQTSSSVQSTFELISNLAKK
jgi:hypothetical protein